MSVKNIANELALAELAKSGNPSLVARRYGVNYQSLIMQFRRMMKEKTITEEVSPEPEDIRTLGNPGMEHMVIAARKATSPDWPEKYASTIEDARKKYDAGTHELATGRVQGWFVLYLIPRKRPVPSRNYFRSMTING